MSGLMNGIFSALDGVLFYVFFEASLDSPVPDHRHLGRFQPGLCGVQVLPVYPHGSLLFLIALLYLFIESGGSFSILDWHKLPLGLSRKPGFSLPSWSPSQSRCRCGRCIHGCPTRTSKRRQEDRSSWQPSP
jgi:hypothetical protein